MAVNGAISRSLLYPNACSIVHCAPGRQWLGFFGSRRSLLAICTKLQAATADRNSSDEEAKKPVTDASKEDLTAKLAAAQAEAAALRKELASRKGVKNIDLSKLTPAAPEKRVDGVGYRETIFSAVGKSLDEKDAGPNKWGFSEAELLHSKVMPTETIQEGNMLVDEKSKEVVKRRLLIGIGITLLAISLAFLKLPVGPVKPLKPLFLYIIPILRLRQRLESLENTASDANFVQLQLKKILDPSEISKETFLSAASFLSGADAELGSSLTYSVFEYLNQADYKRYFDYMGKPSSSQELSFLKFSLQSIQAARQTIDKFIALLPEEELEAAKSRLTS